MDISLRDVTVRLPGEPVQTLFKIKSLNFAAGARVFIEGPSGVGKSTLLHLIAGLFRADSGTMTVGNYAFHELGDAARSRVRRDHFGLVFQKLNLVEHLTALENVQLGLSGQFDITVPQAALVKVGLGDRASDRIGLMSLGEQQRVAVARVLAARPDIVLADEPTSSLDSKNAELVIDRLLDVPKESIVVVVSHDQRIRSRFATALHFKDLIS